MRPTARPLAAAAGLLLLAGLARAESPLHPEVDLLDAEGRSVLETGAPVSARRTCGECHDTDFIAAHSDHAYLGFDEIGEAGRVDGGRPFDLSPGAFGRWSPESGRRLSLPDDADFDLGVAEWIRAFGDRHVGGGPAERGEDGRPLGAPDGLPRERMVLDPASGRALPWDWARSGTVEMNCFVCHLANPANDRRTEALRAGEFRWATTATLANTGLAVPDGAGGWRYDPAAFEADGTAGRERLRLGDPTDAACGACHLEAGAVPEPFGSSGTWAPRDLRGAGQVFHPQPIRDSALNLRGKSALSRPWDVHAARLLACIDCHHAPDNPGRRVATAGQGPTHLTHDARRAGLGDYLRRPSHRFTRGASSGGHAGRRFDRSMRDCVDCHDVRGSHGAWLPHASRHFDAMECTVCHVPRVPGPAVAVVDWTVLAEDGGPVTTWRGVEGPADDPRSLLTGYEPVLLPRPAGGGERLAPHHLRTTWSWFGGSPRRPVRPHDLAAAWRGEGGPVHRDLLGVLDQDGDGTLSPEERRLRTPEQVAAMAARLVAVGVADPRIVGEVEPTLVSHGVVEGAEAVRSCEVCHATDSRISRPFVIAPHVPPGATLDLAPGAGVRWAGPRARGEDGALRYEPRPTEAGRYVLGHDRAGILDRLGLLAIAATVLAATIHGGLRWRAASRRRKEA